MQFIWSGLLALLVVPLLLVLAYVVSQRRRRPVAVRYSSLSLIRAAQPGSSRFRRHLPFALFVAALASLVVALARPVTILAVPANQTSVILAIDVSGSMCSTDIPPSRLAAAEAAAASFIQHQSASTQIGIVAFSGFAEIVQTPTSDQNQLLAALAGLATGRRTAIGSGILASIDAISKIDSAVAASQPDPATGPKPVPVPKGAYAPDIVVLLTDGVSNSGLQPLDAAQEAVDRGVRVYTIGFGTADGGGFDPTCALQFLGREPGAGGQPGGGFGGGGFGGGGFGGGGGAAPGAQNGNGFRRGIDEDTLQKIADMTGGTYHPAETADQLESVFNGLPTYLITKHEVSDVGVAFVGIGGLLAGLALLLGRAWRPLP